MSKRKKKGGTGAPSHVSEPPVEEVAPVDHAAECLTRYRGMLAEQLRLAERDVQQGPKGLGWLHNESKRPAAEAWAAFLKEQLENLPVE